MGMPSAKISTDDTAESQLRERIELEACLAELDDTDAQLLSFHYVDGLTSCEIASLLEVSDITARQMYTDAVENLHVVRNRRR